MKVLYIVTLFPRHEKELFNPWMIETIKRLKERRIEVTVYVPAYRGLGDHHYQGIPVRRFRYFFRRWEILSHDETVPDQIKRNKLFLLLVIPYIIFGLVGLWKLLRREKFDVIHVHWPFPHGIFGYFAARWAQAPLVNQFHGVELRWVRNKMSFFIPFLRWVLRTSNLVIANSSYTKGEIQRISPQTRVEIVPYGSPVPPAVEAQTSTQDPARCRRVLFVGRLVERKGVEHLVRAMKELKLPFPVRLDVVGTGPEEEALRTLVGELGLAERVNLAGKLSSRELRSYYSACDCFVLPAIIDSRGDTEGLGVVLIEALSFKKPVVASSLGGIVDVIKHEKTGLLVPEKDPQALAAAIARVLSDEKLARRLGEQGYRFVSRYYDWERIIHRWVSLYGELVSWKEEKHRSS